ncbi:MAG: hypothetical protein ABSC04_10430 [Syntrophobacteraceae bacterium]|jgi:hypothetical protein
MEELATDRIYRLMIAQRTIHRDEVKLAGDKRQSGRIDARTCEQAFR